MLKFYSLIICVLIVSCAQPTESDSSSSGDKSDDNIIYYTITFEKNDTKAYGSMADQKIASGSKANLSACEFINPGWTFAGWQIPGTGNFIYADQANYVMGKENITMYAKWIPVALGDKGPAGGWVFYDKGYYSNGWRYLECAPVDLTMSAWGTDNFAVPGANGTVIGTGKQNTQSIVQYDTGTSNKAADLCGDYSITNCNILFDEWFLPSRDELNQIYINLYSRGIGGFEANSYWSSSEVSDRNAFYQTFSSGNQDDFLKAFPGRVRPVRAF